MLVGFVENKKDFIFQRKNFYIYYLAEYPVIQPAGYPVKLLASMKKSVYFDISLYCSETHRLRPNSSIMMETLEEI